MTEISIIYQLMDIYFRRIKFSTVVKSDAKDYTLVDLLGERRLLYNFQ